jgi:hypothetical protein
MAATNSRPDDVPGPPPFSQQAHEMLRILDKNHLRDVTNDERTRYGAAHSIGETLCAEYWQWNCPDIEVLVLIHGRDPLAAKVQHWTSVHNRTADLHVKQHAIDQIKQLEARR